MWGDGKATWTLDMEFVLSVKGAERKHDMNLINKKNALKRRIWEAQDGFEKLEGAQGILEDKL